MSSLFPVRLKQSSLFNLHLLHLEFTFQTAQQVRNILIAHQIVYDVVLVIFLVPGVDRLVHLFAHVFLQRVAVSEILLAINTVQTGMRSSDGSDIGD